MGSRMNKKCFIPLVIGIVVLIVGLVLVFVVFPNVIKKQISENVVLEEGSDQMERFKKIPFPFKFSVYLYTIENKDEVLNNGKKPKVKEVGPYVYDEYKNRRILGRESDNITYEEVWSFKFNKSASGSLSEDDEITVVNAPLIALLQNLEDLSLPIPPSIIGEVLGEIFDSTELFMTVKVGDIAFKGIKMCHKKDKGAIAKLVCLTITLMNQKLLEYHEDFTLFSLFKYKTKADGPYVLQSGVSDIEKLGLITSYKGMEYTNFWSGNETECDKVNGYFTTFPPFMKENSSYNVYSSDVCKSAVLGYDKEGEYKGISSYQFKTHSESFAGPNQTCACIYSTKGLDGSRHCFNKGVLDMNKCMGVPVIMSFPHLMWADDAYRNSIEDERNSVNDTYNTVIDFQPHLGIPLRGAIRLQFNMVLRPVNISGAVFPMTANWPKALFPIVWLEDSFQLTDELVEEMDSKLFDKLLIADAVQWTIVALGAALIVLSIILLIACRKKEKLSL